MVQVPLHVVVAGFQAEGRRELSVSSGDRVGVLKAFRSGWVACISASSGAVGLVPGTYLSHNPAGVMTVPAETEITLKDGKREVPPLPKSKPKRRLPPDAAAQRARWYIESQERDVAREAAHRLQQNGPIGGFFVRVPESKPTAYALAVKTNSDKIQNFLIKCEDNRFHCAGHNSRSLSGIIAKLAAHASSLPVMLVGDDIGRPTSPAEMTVPATGQRLSAAKKKKHKKHKHKHHRSHEKTPASPKRRPREGAAGSSSDDDSSDEDDDEKAPKAIVVTAQHDEAPVRTVRRDNVVAAMPNLSELEAAIHKTVGDNERRQRQDAASQSQTKQRAADGGYMTQAELRALTSRGGTLTLEAIQAMAEQTKFCDIAKLKAVDSSIAFHQPIKTSLLTELHSRLTILQTEQIGELMRAGVAVTPEDIQAMAVLNHLLKQGLLSENEIEHIVSGHGLGLSQQRIQNLMNTLQQSASAGAARQAAIAALKAKGSPAQAKKVPPPPPVRTVSLSSQHKPIEAERAAARKAHVSEKASQDSEESTSKQEKAVSFRGRDSVYILEDSSGAANSLASPEKTSPAFHHHRRPTAAVANSTAADQGETSTDVHRFGTGTLLRSGIGTSTDEQEIAGVPTVDESTDVLRVVSEAETVTLREEGGGFEQPCPLDAVRAKCKHHASIEAGDVISIPVSDQNALAFAATWFTGETLPLSERSSFAVWSVAHYLGATELESMACERILANLSIQNAMYCFETAYQLGVKAVERISLQLIAMNAEQCMAVPGALNVTLEPMCRILGSDSLCLPEEDVWELILAYAKHRHGLSGSDDHVALGQDNDDALDDDDDAGFGFGFGDEGSAQQSMLSDEDKESIADTVATLSEHMRVLLVSASFFQSKVDPLGLLPHPQATLWREYQANPSAVAGGEIQRQQRSGRNHFRGSHLLALEHQKLVNAWYARPHARWRLLYRASKDGFDADTFHALCDGRRSTCVVVKTTTGYLFGGVCDVPWSSSSTGAAQSTPYTRSFVFSLLKAEKFRPQRYIHSGGAVIYCHSRTGPSFGGGSGKACDFTIASNSHTNEESTCNFPQCYGVGSSATAADLAGARRFQVADIEVFGLDSTNISVTSF